MENKKLNFRIIEFGIQSIVYIVYLIVNLFYLRRFHYVSCVVIGLFCIKNMCLLKSKVCQLPPKELRKKWRLMYPLYFLATLLILAFILKSIDHFTKCRFYEIGYIAIAIYFDYPFVVIVVSLIGELIQIIRERIEKVRKQYIHIYLCVLRWCMVYLLIVFAIGTDQFYATTRVRYYEEDSSYLNENSIGFFPNVIPKEARNVEFYSTPGELFGEKTNQVRLKMIVSEEYISHLIDKYKEIVTDETIQECAVLTKDNSKEYFYERDLYENIGEYFGKENCTVYFWYRHDMGFVVDTTTNEVKLFYDSNIGN